MTSTALIDSSGISLVSSPSTSPGDAASGLSPKWSDEDAEDAAGVLRRLQETEAQLRNTRNVRELKSLYNNTCTLCGKRTIIGVNPLKHYSEAAHIRPVGQPHNGPDRKDNMIILCLEHHLQFDRGLLRLQKTGSGFRVISKISGDPLNGSNITLQAPHVISEDCVSWHFKFWNSR